MSCIYNDLIYSFMLFLHLVVLSCVLLLGKILCLLPFTSHGLSQMSISDAFPSYEVAAAYSCDLSITSSFNAVDGLQQ